MNFKCKGLLVGVCLFLSACGTIGPARLPSERQDYNEAMANSNNQQLLLNIVRLHNGTPPLFLQVSNISTQDVIEGSSGNGVGFSHAASGVDSVDTTSLYPALTLGEHPTISYSPLQGAAFANQLLQPLPIQYIYYLCRSGWPIDQVLSLTLEDLNNFPNVVESSPLSFHDKHKTFDRILFDLRQLQLNNALRFYYSLYNTQHDTIPILIINVYPNGKKMQAWKDLVSLLHLNPAHSQIVLSEYYPAYKGGDLHTETRSFLGVLLYLSSAVQGLKHPEAQPDAASSHARTWFDVKASASQPVDAYLAVQYHDEWYYLDKKDTTSKMTMLALFELFELATGDNAKVTPPVLTLPLH